MFGEYGGYEELMRMRSVLMDGGWCRAENERVLEKEKRRRRHGRIEGGEALLRCCCGVIE